MHSQLEAMIFYFKTINPLTKTKKIKTSENNLHITNANLIQKLNFFVKIVFLIKCFRYLLKM